MAALVSSASPVANPVSSKNGNNSVDLAVVNPSGNLFLSAAGGLENGSATRIMVNVKEEVKEERMEILANPKEVLQVPLDIVNVVSTFKTHCHVDLRKLALAGLNVEFRRDPPSVLMRIRKPAITASIWSVGKVTCIGAKSEASALVGARRVARKIQQCGFKLRFMDFKIINCLAVAYLPFGVRIDRLKDCYPREFSYEPELHPGATWKLPEVSGQLQIFQTGNLTITAPNEASAHKTLETVYAKLYEFRKPKELTETQKASNRKEERLKRKTELHAATSSKKFKPAALANFKPAALMDWEDDEEEDSGSDLEGLMM